MIGQDLSEKVLNIAICARPHNRSHEFDFDADFPIDSDLAFHTLSIAHRAQCASQHHVLFLPLLSSAISATTMRSDMHVASSNRQPEADDEALVDRIC